MNPKVIMRTDDAYEKLLAVAAVLQATSKNKARYAVREVYFDLGQDWMWTTICREGYSACQILSPRQWEMIITASNAEELFECVKYIQSDKYFMDI